MVDRATERPHRPLSVAPPGTLLASRRDYCAKSVQARMQLAQLNAVKYPTD